MLAIYRGLINFLNLISPLIVFYRIRNNKEDPVRYKEKFCKSTLTRKRGKLIWFHGSSVGEILSIVPLIIKLEKDKEIKQILVTSSTLSSSKVFKKFKFRKTIHQFFPIDTKSFIKKFLGYWKPSLVFFVESEIWPNCINEIKKSQIKLILINARITKKTFNRWMMIKSFSKSLFEKFDLCLSQNKETSNFLKNLGAKNIKSLGNLKFSEYPENLNISLENKLNKFLNAKKNIFGAISTHDNEEIFCAKLHIKLKKKLPKFLTIIIPRHVDRGEKIIESLNKLNLKVHRHSSKKIIDRDVDIYLVDTFGETKSFLKKCSIVFLGGSLIQHGGQNPLEAARYGCKVLHGPSISNFIEVYNLLKKYNISSKIKNEKDAIRKIITILKRRNIVVSNTLKLNAIGKSILSKNYKEIKKYI